MPVIKYTEQPGAKPWERMGNEGVRAFEAFSEYISQGPDRTLAKVAKKLKKSTTIMGRWSAEHDWVARAAEWDNHERAEILKRLVAQRARHRADINDFSTRLLGEATKSLEAEVKEGNLTAAQIGTYVGVIEKLNRTRRDALGMGKADENLDMDGASSTHAGPRKVQFEFSDQGASEDGDEEDEEPDGGDQPQDA